MTGSEPSGAQAAPDHPDVTPADLAEPHRDLGAALFFALWAAVGWYAVYGDAYLWSDFGADPGPSLLPAIVLTLLTFGSLGMLVGAIQKLLVGTGTMPSSGIFKRSLMPLLYIGSLIALVPLMRTLGFVPAASVFAIGWMFVLHDRQRHSGFGRLLIEVLVATAIGIGLIYYFLVRVINVPLP